MHREIRCVFGILIEAWRLSVTTPKSSNGMKVKIGIEEKEKNIL